MGGENIAKVSMKTLFGKRNIKADGTEGKVRQIESDGAGKDVK